MEDFRKNYNEESDDQHFLKVNILYANYYMNFIMIYHFYQKKRKFKKSKNFQLICMLCTLEI